MCWNCKPPPFSIIRSRAKRNFHAIGVDCTCLSAYCWLCSQQESPLVLTHYRLEIMRKALGFEGKHVFEQAGTIVMRSRKVPVGLHMAREWRFPVCSSLSILSWGNRIFVVLKGIKRERHQSFFLNLQIKTHPIAWV